MALLNVTPSSSRNVSVTVITASLRRLGRSYHTSKSSVLLLLMAQLLQLFEERRNRLAEFQHDVRARFDREHESLRGSIQRILTPAQFERFESELRKRRPRPFAAGLIPRGHEFEHLVSIPLRVQ